MLMSTLQKDVDVRMSKHDLAGHLCFLLLTISLICKIPTSMSSTCSGNHSI